MIYEFQLSFHKEALNIPSDFISFSLSLSFWMVLLWNENIASELLQEQSVCINTVSSAWGMMNAV